MTRSLDPLYGIIDTEQRDCVADSGQQAAGESRAGNGRGRGGQEREGRGERRADEMDAGTLASCPSASGVEPLALWLQSSP